MLEETFGYHEKGNDIVSNLPNKKIQNKGVFLLYYSSQHNFRPSLILTFIIIKLFKEFLDRISIYFKIY